jgi:peptidylprolyl isomerase
VALTSCATASRAVAPTYAAQLGIDLTAMTRMPSGLYWQDVATGDGALAEAGRTVRVLYNCFLPDGTRFDGTTDVPLAFALGRGAVIAGWDEGIVGMRVGGRRRLVVPPALGYGSEARADRIPPNSTLVFDIQLVGVSEARARVDPRPPST